MIDGAIDETTILSRVLNILGWTEPFTPHDAKYQTYRTALHRRRRSLLSKHYWGFAAKFEKLIPAVKPEYFYSQAHLLPPDFLKVVYMNSRNVQGLDENPYQIISDGQVYSNFKDLYLCYTADVVEYNTFSPLFEDALVLSVAIELCMPLTQDKEHLRDLFAMYKELEFESINIEHRDDGIRQTIQNRTLERARSGIEGGGPGDFGFGWPPVEVRTTPFEGVPSPNGNG